MAALDINFGRTQMMQRELASQPGDLGRMARALLRRGRGGGTLEDLGLAQGAIAGGGLCQAFARRLAQNPIWF